MRRLSNFIYSLLPFHHWLSPMVIYFTLGTLKLCKCIHAPMLMLGFIEPIEVSCYFLLWIEHGHTPSPTIKPDEPINPTGPSP